MKQYEIIILVWKEAKNEAKREKSLEHYLVEANDRSEAINLGVEACKEDLANFNGFYQITKAINVIELGKEITKEKLDYIKEELNRVNEALVSVEETLEKLDYLTDDYMYDYPIWKSVQNARVMLLNRQENLELALMVDNKEDREYHLNKGLER